LIIILSLIFIYFGFRWGVLKDSFLVGGFILGITQGGKSAERITPLLETIFPFAFSKVIAFLIVLFFFLLLFRLLSFTLYHIFYRMNLGWLDSILGGIWGFLKGMVLIWFGLVLTLNLFPESRAKILSSELSLRILAFGKNFPPLLKIEREIVNIQKSILSLSGDELLR